MKNLCPDCETIHEPDAPCFVTSHYHCPECGQDWSDTWTCACNSQCPACGLKDIEPLTDDMEMARAFEIVLELARDNQIDASELPEQNAEQGAALDIVTAFYLLKVKG